MSKYNVLEDKKYPVTKHHYIGIEIEFLCPYYDDDVRKAIVDNGLEHNCHLGDDGSIETEASMSKEDETLVKQLEKKQQVIFNKYFNNNPYYGRAYPDEYYEIGSKIYDITDKYPSYDDENCFELRVLCIESELKDVLSRVSIVLKKIKAEVNKSCGLHVHLDMRYRDPKKCFDMLLKKQDEMFAMVDASRRLNEYCKRSTKYGETDRRRAINTASVKEHSTIEIRLHEGTVNTKDILMWCRYLSNIVNKKTSRLVDNYVKRKIKSAA